MTRRDGSGKGAAMKTMANRGQTMSLPPGRDATITTVGQAVRLARLTAPLHPILVHFTIALTVIAFVFDLLAFVFGIDALMAAGWWTLAAATLVTIATIATGVTSRLRVPVEEGAARSFLRAHMALGPTLFGFLVAICIWRAGIWQAGADVTGWYLVAMAGVVLAMAAQGYLGGELVYRYGVEVKGSYRQLAERARPRPEAEAEASATKASTRR